MADVFFSTLHAYADQAAHQGNFGPGEAEIIRFRINRCAQHYAVYLRHEIRGHWENQFRPKCVANLNDNQVVIVCDWKMKFLMSVFREHG